MANRLLQLLICVLAANGVSTSAHAGAGVSAKWVPAMSDSDSCDTLRRAYYARCRPRGSVRLRGAELRLSVDLGNCESSRSTSLTPAAWLVIHATVLRPQFSHCACPAVGCCQPLPTQQLFALPLVAADGKAHVRASLALPTNGQVEVSRMEIRAAGDCFQSEVVDAESGETIPFSAGPALSVSGTGRIPQPSN